MVYNKKMVAAVKVEGKILWDEDCGNVYLPYGTEYSLMIKNMESRKALVKISIDGQLICEGGFIILPNTSIEIERYVSDLNKGNRFKFIEKTQQIKEHRGDKIDDGLIRIEYWFEKNRWQLIPFPENIVRKGEQGYLSRGVYSSSVGAISCGYFSSSNNISQNREEGITVPGSISEQKFSYGSIGTLEDESNVIVLKLRGQIRNGNVVTKPIKVREKTICPTCGTKSKTRSSFCSNCGTSLEII